MSGDIAVATFAAAILTIAHSSRSYIPRYFYLGFIYLAFALYEGFALNIFYSRSSVHGLLGSKIKIQEKVRL